MKEKGWWPLINFLNDLGHSQTKKQLRAEWLFFKVNLQLKLTTSKGFSSARKRRVDMPEYLMRGMRHNHFVVKQVFFIHTNKITL